MDFGVNWILIASAFVLLLPIGWLELHYWKHLSIPIVVGIPELSRHPKGKLLREGIYGVIRHPRYLSGGIGLVVNALVVNNLGLYILLVLVAPSGYLLLVLEERELVERFGDEYREYQRDVPILIPRVRRRIS